MRVVTVEGVTGLVLGDGPAMLTRTRVGWVLAAGGRRSGCCNYYSWKGWRGVVYAVGNEVAEANDEQRGVGVGGMSRVASVTGC